MENDDLLSVLKFLLVKIQDLDIKISAMQMVLHSQGISSPEQYERIRQQIADSPESESVRTLIRTLGPYDQAIAQIVQALGALGG